LFLLPIASDFNRILPGLILKQQSAMPAKALKFTLACPITIYPLGAVGAAIVPGTREQQRLSQLPF
jgi:hypothetical protein